MRPPSLVQLHRLRMFETIDKQTPAIYALIQEYDLEPVVVLYPHANGDPVVLRNLLERNRAIEQERTLQQAAIAPAGDPGVEGGAEAGEHLRRA